MKASWSLSNLATYPFWSEIRTVRSVSTYILVPESWLYHHNNMSSHSLCCKTGPQKREMRAQRHLHNTWNSGMSAHAEQAGVLSQTDARQIKCAVIFIITQRKAGRELGATGMASGAQCRSYPTWRRDIGRPESLSLLNGGRWSWEGQLMEMEVGGCR